MATQDKQATSNVASNDAEFNALMIFRAFERGDYTLEYTLNALVATMFEHYQDGIHAKHIN